MVSNSRIEASSGFTGFIQVAKEPVNAASGEAVYDAGAGVYASGASLSGSTSGRNGTYTLRWTRAGLTGSQAQLLMFALPHHVQSFDVATNQGKTSVQLRTTTKGVATAVLRDSWTMVESNLPVDMGFAPWTTTSGSVTSLSSTARQAINRAAASEVSQDMDAQSNLNSMYFSGKV